MIGSTPQQRETYVSSLIPPIGPESLVQFIRDVGYIQSEFGHVCGLHVYDRSGHQIGTFNNFARFREDLFELSARAARSIEDDPHLCDAAAYVGLFATEQRDPSGGYDVTAEVNIKRLSEIFEGQRITVLHWVEAWQDEIRIPDWFLHLHMGEDKEQVA